MKKLFTLLTLLVAIVTGAWADAITVTWLPNNMSSITTAGTASVADILTVSDLSTSTDLANPSIVTYDSKKWGNFLCSTASAKNAYSKDDYITFSVTVKSGYIFYPTSVIAYSVGAGTGEAGAKIFSTVQTENGTSAVVNSSNAATPTILSLSSFSSPSYDGGSTMNFYIHVGSKNNAKGVCIRDVVLTGTYDVAGMTKLSTPEITVTQATGKVTIGSVANASKVTYTIDGTDPTASSTTYSAPFIVDANCTIKAIAIGDGVSYSNSNIASQAANITVANPVLTAHNGTVGITCATDGATIKYSTDNETWTDYSHPLTYFSNTTVYAKAEHASYKNNSSTVNLAVSAAPAATAGSQTKILQWVTPGDNNWEYMSGDNGNGGTTNYGIQGKADTADEGWSLWISSNGSGYYDKGLGAATNTTTIDEVTYSFMKNSNGRQFNIGMPSNLRANRITIYSYNAGDDQSTIWSTVGGSTYTTSTEVSIISSNNESPEIRVFSLDDVANNIILNNAGFQQCFMVVVDYTVYVPGPADAEEVTEEGSITEAITFTSSSSLSQTTDPSSVTAIMTLTGGSYKPATLTGFSTDTYKAYEFGSNANLTIAIPSGASNISLELLGTASNSTLKYNGASAVDPGWSSDATSGGYIATIKIDDSYAGTNFVITKGSNNTNLHRIVLTYTGEIATDDITLTTSDNMAGWRAFYDASSGYTLDNNTTAYVATANDNSSVTMTALAGGVPAGTPVILKTTSSADNHKMTLTKATVNAYEGTNLLEWTTTAVDSKYRLGYGDKGVGFYPYSGTPASGAVILNTSGSAKALTFIFSDPTGISSVGANKAVSTGKRYNLSGQIVGEGYKGIVIVNGKKVIK